MVNKENALSVGQQVKWIGSHDTLQSVKSLEHKNVYFYQKCIYGPLTLTVGDYILVSNADAAEPDTVNGCDVARILHMYELREVTDREPCRAIVQWYSRPQAIPHIHFDDDRVSIDFGLEVIEEHRPYDSDVALGAIYRKCIVLEGTSHSSAEEIVQRKSHKLKSTACPMFVSRYKFVKVKRSYRLIPLEIHLEEPASKPLSRSERKSLALHESKRSSSARKDAAAREEATMQKRRRASMAAASSLEFVDVSYFNCENKVSPIKIVGGRSVVRLSEKKKTSAQEEINANYLPASPLTEKNAKVETPKSRASAARRNLNLSLDRGADSTADSDCLNYSIVQQTPDPKTPSNDMKIKLRLSERRRSVRLASMDHDPLEIVDETRETPSSRKRLGVTTGDIYHTPTKKAKELPAMGTELTPSTRRKSILKSATSRLGKCRGS